MEQKIDNSNVQITLRDIIQLVKKYLNLFWVRKFYWLIIVLIFSALLAISYMRFKPTYEAPLTFMINEESSGSGSVSGILGQFGIGGNSSQFNRKKVNYLIKTYKIQEDALFDTVNFSNSQDYLINEIIEAYSLDTKWAKKNPELSGFRFRSKLNPNNATESAAFKKTFNFLNDDKNKIISSFLNDDTGIYTIKTNTPDPELSINLANQLYLSLSKFYVNQAIERQSFANKVLKQKLDSIENQISRTNYSIANFRDRSKSTWSSRADVSVQKLEQDRVKLATIYSEAVKSYEMSTYNLKTQTPVFQVVDEPLSPLEMSQFNLIGNLFFIIIGSLGLYFLLVIIFQVYIENS